MHARTEELYDLKDHLMSESELHCN